MRQLRIFLDANILVDAPVRDLFCRLGEKGLIELRWSQEILVEVRRALTTRLHLSSDQVDRLFDALRRAFPDATINGYEHLIANFDLPDVDDRHVAAAAVHGECDLLVTYNIGDFPSEPLEPYDLAPVSVDEALVFLTNDFGAHMAQVIDEQLAALKRPPQTREVFVDQLAKRAPHGAVVLGAWLGLENYVKMFHEMTSADGPESPQQAVGNLLELVRENRVEGLSKLIDTDLGSRLVGGTGAPHPSKILSALRTILEDTWTTEWWGFATAPRLHGPDTEIVKYVRHDTPVSPIYTKPTMVHAHLFVMRRDSDTWIITDINSPDPSLTEPATNMPSD